MSALSTLLSPRLGLKPLAALCRRVGISTDAGIDVRRIWEREAQSARGGVKRQLENLHDAVATGESLAVAFSLTGPLFPQLMREMVNVGEQTGTLSEIFLRLADYYEYRYQMRRVFLSKLTWPMLQLSIAVGVVGLLIWIMGFLAQNNGGQPIDLLGIGLVGDQGLVIYFGFIGLTVAAVTAVIVAAMRGVFWTKPLQHAILFVPGLGKCLQTLALARMAWTLNLTLNVEMPLKRLLPLALRSTGNDYYIQYSDQVVADVMGGREIHEALRRTQIFPNEMLDVVEVGETTGYLVESMGRLSEQYESQAKTAMDTLSVLAGFGIWAMVATLIIVLIFRLAMFYLNTINSALEGF